MDARAGQVDRTFGGPGVSGTDRFSTAPLPPVDQYRCWKEQIAGMFVGLDASRIGHGAERAPFDIEVTRRAIALDAGEQVDFIEAVSDAQSVWRSPRLIREATGEWLLLALQIDGTSSVVRGGERLALRPGDMILLDTAQPYRLHFPERFRHLVVKVPRERLAMRLPRTSAWLWRTVSARTPMGSVLTAHLRAVVPALEALDPAMRPVLVERTLDLVALTFAGALREYAGAGSTVQQALVARARSVVEARIADPSLSPAVVAAALGISRGYLHRLFRSAGTGVAGYIRDCRFRGCRADLADPLRAGENVTEIAMRWGLSDMPHFSRAFRNRFGMAPREYRSMALGARSFAPSGE